MVSITPKKKFCKLQSGASRDRAESSKQNVFSMKVIDNSESEVNSSTHADGSCGKTINSTEGTQHYETNTISSASDVKLKGHLKTTSNIHDDSVKSVKKNMSVMDNMLNHDSFLESPIRSRDRSSVVRTESAILANSRSNGSMVGHIQDSVIGNKRNSSDTEGTRLSGPLLSADASDNTSFLPKYPTTLTLRLSASPYFYEFLEYKRQLIRLKEVGIIKLKVGKSVEEKYDSSSKEIENSDVVILEDSITYVDSSDGDGGSGHIDSNTGSTPSENMKFSLSSKMIPLRGPTEKPFSPDETNLIDTDNISYDLRIKDGIPKIEFLSEEIKLNSNGGVVFRAVESSATDNSLMQDSIEPKLDTNKGDTQQFGNLRFHEPIIFSSSSIMPILETSLESTENIENYFVVEQTLSTIRDRMPGIFVPNSGGLSYFNHEKLSDDSATYDYHKVSEYSSSYIPQEDHSPSFTSSHCDNLFPSLSTNTPKSSDRVSKVNNEKKIEGDTMHCKTSCWIFVPKSTEIFRDFQSHLIDYEILAGIMDFFGEKCTTGIANSEGDASQECNRVIDPHRDFVTDPSLPKEQATECESTDPPDRINILNTLNVLPSKKNSHGFNSIGVGKNSSFSHLIDDTRYMYYLKKTGILNTNNKQIVAKYILDISKNLKMRCIRNTAEDIGRKSYHKEYKGSALHHKDMVDEPQNNPTNFGEDNQLIIISEDTAGGKHTTSLRILASISPIVHEPYDTVEFAYAVYKFNNDLIQIQRYLGLGMQHVILLYYLYYFDLNRSLYDGDMYSHDNGRGDRESPDHTESLWDLLSRTVAEREWSEEDVALFRKSYLKQNRRFDNYATFTEAKSEGDLRLFYHYFNKEYLTKEWTETDRIIFYTFYEHLHKNWAQYTKICMIRELSSDVEEGRDALPHTELVCKYRAVNIPETAEGSAEVGPEFSDAIFLNKSVEEIKRFYSNYYKRLAEELLEGDRKKYRREVDWDGIVLMGKRGRSKEK